MAKCQPMNKVIIKTEFKQNDASPDSPLFMPKTFFEQFERMVFIVNENVRLCESWKYRNEEMQSIVKETKHMWEFANAKTRTCQRCTELESRIKNQENIISDLVEAIPMEHDSYEILTQRVQKIEKPTSEIFGRDKVNKEDSDDSIVMKSPETYRKPDNLDVSPVVKRSRNNKRRLKCISSRKKNKLEDGENVRNADLELDFPDLEVISYSSKSRKETPDTLDIKNTGIIVPLDKIDEVNNTITEEPSLNGVEDIIEPTQKTSNRRTETLTRRSLTFNLKKPNLNDATIEQLPTEECSKMTKNSPENMKSSFSPVNNNNKEFAAGVVFRSPEKYKKTLPNDPFEKMKQQTKWNLTKRREPTITKLKQTLLSTTTLEKKTDISTLETFNGGLMRTSEAKTNNTDENLVSKKVTENKENSVIPVPSFDSAVTSTANDIAVKTPLKIDKFSKYTANVVENSFDVIPKTSPNYKYKRDAVRKKFERRKLPGQDCESCAKYYNLQRDLYGETQARKMIDKCSRHRDKFPIQSNTPPGFWNPVFDTDNDDEPAK